MRYEWDPINIEKDNLRTSLIFSCFFVCLVWFGLSWKDISCSSNSGLGTFCGLVPRLWCSLSAEGMGSGLVLAMLWCHIIQWEVCVASLELPLETGVDVWGTYVSFYTSMPASVCLTVCHTRTHARTHARTHSRARTHARTHRHIHTSTLSLSGRSLAFSHQLIKRVLVGFELAACKINQCFCHKLFQTVQLG